MDQEKKYVLVLGGSTFMGKDLMGRLSAEPNTEVHFINRGRKYWNNEVKQLPNLNFTYGNRKDNTDFTKLLKYLSKKLDITEDSKKKWDLVVDFSAFRRRNVKSVYNGLKGLIRLYILISTDSIYDVCDQKVRNLPRIIEEFAVRPKDPKSIKKLKKDEDYGHDKLKCEEFLYAQEDKSLFPFIVFRLPDIIGPYDDTGRFWAYILWMRYYQTFPIEMEDDDIKHKMSFVYSADVVTQIMNLLHKIGTDELNDKNLNQSYNLAFDESMNLPQLLKYIADGLKLEIKCKVVDDSNNTYYPSVECGPLDTNKAKTLIGWKPTEFDIAILETIVFFLKAEQKYPVEFKDAFKKLPKYIKEYQYQQNKKAEEMIKKQATEHKNKQALSNEAQSQKVNENKDQKIQPEEQKQEMADEAK